jgi:hypothetical protein
VADRLISLVHEARHSDCPANPALEQKLQTLVAQAQLRHEAAEQRILYERQHGASPSGERNAFVQSELNAARALQEQIQMALSEIEKSPECAYAHSDCPLDHPDPTLRGAKHGCDAHAWGAFSVGGIFAQALAQACQDCSEVERQRATASALDSLDRVVPLNTLLEDKNPPGLERDHVRLESASAAETHGVSP